MKTIAVFCDGKDGVGGLEITSQANRHLPAQDAVLSSSANIVSPRHFPSKNCGFIFLGVLKKINRVDVSAIY